MTWLETMLLGLLAQAADMVRERVRWGDFDSVMDEYLFRARCHGWRDRGCA